MSSKAGTRLARATGPADVKFGMSTSNNLQIAVPFRFTNQDDEFFGQTITWIGTFAPGKASEIALQALENCGWQGEDVLDLTGIDSNDVELVIVDEWNADETKRYCKVAFVNRSGAGRFTFQHPVEGNELVAHAKGLGQSIRAIRASQGRRPAATRPRTPAQPSRAPATAEPEGPPLFGEGENEFDF